MSHKRVARAILVLLLVALGTVLAWVVVEVRSYREFIALRHEGDQIIIQFEKHRPNPISAHGWGQLVGNVHTAWANIFDFPGCVAPSRLKAALEELRRLEADADPANSTKRLDQVFDLLLRYRPEKERYIEGMRETYRYGLSQLRALAKINRSLFSDKFEARNRNAKQTPNPDIHKPV